MDLQSNNLEQDVADLRYKIDELERALSFQNEISKSNKKRCKALSNFIAHLPQDTINNTLTGLDSFDFDYICNNGLRKLTYNDDYKTIKCHTRNTTPLQEHLEELYDYITQNFDKHFPISPKIHYDTDYIRIKYKNSGIELKINYVKNKDGWYLNDCFFEKKSCFKFECVSSKITIGELDQWIIETNNKKSMSRVRYHSDIDSLFIEIRDLFDRCDRLTGHMRLVI